MVAAAERSVSPSRLPRRSSTRPPNERSSPDEPAYRLLRLIGRGAMGKVFLAQRSDRSAKLQAVKFSRSSGMVSSDVAALVGLKHLNLAEVYSVDRVGRFVVTKMEFVSGRTWRELLDTHGPLPESVTAWIGIQAASALAALHRRGFLHRDVQPRNLLVDRRSLVKLIDFDLVLSTTSGAPERVAGTPDYLAPEQVLGRRPLTDRVDVYSLGCTLWHLLTGHPLFAHVGNRRNERIQAHVREPAPDTSAFPQHVGRGFVHLLRAMLAKTPHDRPSALEVAEQLRRLACRGQSFGAGTPTWAFSERELQTCDYSNESSLELTVTYPNAAG